MCGPKLRDRGVVAGPLGIEPPPAARTAAWSRRCRNRGRTAPRRSAAISPRRISCRIFPGCASAAGSLALAWSGASRRSTPRATRGIQPQHLQRGDQAVAAERGRIPGNAGVGIGPLRRIGDQHVEVGHRPAQHLVENLVRGDDGRGVSRYGAHVAARRAQSPKRTAWASVLRLVAVDGEKNRRPRSARAETDSGTFVASSVGAGSKVSMVRRVWPSRP